LIDILQSVFLLQTILMIVTIFVTKSALPLIASKLSKRIP